VQGSDGDLVVGDSHHTEWSPSPFSEEAVDDLMLAEMQAVLDLPGARVVERWTGTYASLPDRLMVREAPDDGIRLVIVTSGTGASTGFAIAEETINENRRAHRGGKMSGLQAVAFDWAGTMIDHGSLAKMGVFVQTFAEFGVEISIDEARGPMGMAKRDHIQALMSEPRIAGRGPRNTAQRLARPTSTGSTRCSFRRTSRWSPTLPA
jgi:hypothetical protein